MADDNAGGLSPADLDAMTRTMVTEAASNDPMGWAAVGSVIRNRLQAGKYGDTPSQIVQAPNQFEVWSNGRAQAVDPNSAAYQGAARVAQAIASGLPDVTGGATHFYSPSGQAALGRSAPSWGRSAPLAAIGGQLFYAPQGAVTLPQAPAAAAIDSATTQPQQGQPVAEDPLATLKRYGVQTDASTAASPAPQAAPASSQATGVSFAAPEPPAPAAPPIPQAGAGETSDDVLARYGVSEKPAPTDLEAARAYAGEIAATNGGAPADIKNVPTALNDPIYHGAVPIRQAPDQGALTAFATGVQGAPIVGPAISKGVQNVAAAARAVANDTPYSAEQKRVQELADIARAQHPYAATAGDVTGATLATAPLAAAAPSAFGISNAPLAVRALTSGLTSGAIGGADAGARGQNLLMGAALGTGGGALGPVAGRVIGSTINAAGNAFAPGVDGVGRLARNYLINKLAADTPEAVQDAAARLGPNAMLPDLGPSMLGAAQGVAIRPGEGKTPIFNALTARSAGANDRINTDLNSLLGPANEMGAQGANDTILAQRAAQGSAYQPVHAQGAPVDVSDVVNLIDNRLGTPQNPIATGAQRIALQNLRTQLVATPAQAATDTAAAVPESYHTNSEYLHNLRQDIDMALDGSAPSLGVPAGALQRAQGSLGAVRGALDTALKEQVPGMAETDAASAALARQAEALKTGTQTLGAGKTTESPAYFAQEYANMAPAEQDALREGLRSEIGRLVGTKSNDPAALRSELQGDGGWNTAKMATVFGDEPVNNLVNAVGREQTFGNTVNAVQGNAQTAFRQAAAKDLEDKAPVVTDLKNVTVPGLIAHYGKKYGYDTIVNHLLTPDNATRDAQLGRALSLQGADRDTLINQLTARMRGQNRFATAGTNADALTTALSNPLIGQYLRQRNALASQ